MDAATLAIALLAGHALADYPLQGDFLSKAKNRTAPIPGVPWQQALGAHVVIHGAFVAHSWLSSPAYGGCSSQRQRSTG